MADDQRIVVTGMGVVSALGHNLVDTWEGLSSGRSGVEKIHLFDPHRLSVQIAAQVPNWQPADYMPKKEARRMDRYKPVRCGGRTRGRAALRTRPLRRL